MTNKIDYHTTNFALYSVRYALDKSTPAVWEVINALKAKWTEISPAIQAQIVKEVARGCMTSAGDARAEWEAFVKWVAES